MGIRTYCDICEKEIKQGDEAGAVSWSEKRYTIDDTTHTEPQIVPVTKMGCNKCFIKIKKLFKK